MTHSTRSKIVSALLPAAILMMASTPAHAAILSFTSLTKMTNNATSFNLSVFDGKASYQPNIDTGSNAVITLGDGTLLDWKLLGGSNLGGQLFNNNNTGYSNGPAAYINDPTSFSPAAGNPPATINSVQPWGKVWTTNDPGADFLLNPANLTSFTVLDAGANSDPRGPITGTVNIASLTSGQFYLFAGGYQSNTDYIVSLSGPSQTTLTASHNDAINLNNNRVNSVLFEFTNPDGLYDTLTYTYRHNASSIRGRFMGVALDGVVAIPEPSTIVLGGLGLLGLIGYDWRRKQK